MRPAPLPNKPRPLLWIIPPIQNGQDYATRSLLHKINDVIRLLKHDPLDRTELSRKQIRIPRDPAHRLLIFLQQMSSAVRPPGFVMLSRRQQIPGNFRQRLDRFAFHAERTRRISSSCEIGLLAADR